jgi:nucleoside-diphosphate-sugar epimerase
MGPRHKVFAQRYPNLRAPFRYGEADRGRVPFWLLKGGYVERKPTVLIAGASGVVGQAAARHFASLPGWRVVSVSRRPPSVSGASEWLPLDLGDEGQCDRVLSSRRDITHVVYAALYEADGLVTGWLNEQVMQRNEFMLRNLMEPLLAAAPIEHVSLMQGTKAYGMHHPSIGWAGVKNPLRERDGRAVHPNFYFLQEDYLRARQEGASWALTTFRPTVIYGDAIGNNMNLIPVLGAWAALLRAEGRPLDFPGRHVSTMVKEAVDADLVARALAWAATCPDAHGGTFNLTNGDVFLWQNVWPAIAEIMGMRVGEHRYVQLAEEMPRRSEQWAALVDQFKLRAPRDILAFVGLNSLVYADNLLSGEDPPVGPVLHSTVAVRKAGFHDCMDSEAMFGKWFRRLVDQGLLPPATSTPR